MRYKMRQKLMSFGDDYKIEDEDGNDVYFVDGKAFSIGSKLSFQDMDGNELAYISQKLLALKKTFRIYRNDEMFAEVVKDWTIFKDQFSIDVPGPNDYEVKGDFIDHEYEFIRGDETVATVSKKYFSFADTYGIDIVDGEDDITILSTAVVIDQICHEPDDHD